MGLSAARFSDCATTKAVLAADECSDAVPVRAFRPRMVCTRCGIVGADARNWREMRASGNWRSGPAITT